jgi:hypothetical protein
VEPARVVVRVEPRLVADLLARLLSSPDIDVVVDLTGGTVEVAGSDVLVTSAPLPAVVPRAAVCLGDGVAPGSACVVTGGSTEHIAVQDLESIAQIVRGLCAIDHGKAAGTAP